jgi:hypothetical protein
MAGYRADMNGVIQPWHLVVLGVCCLSVAAVVVGAVLLTLRLSRRR